jgi:hypothetical protein
MNLDEFVLACKIAVAKGGKPLASVDTAAASSTEGNPADEPDTEVAGDAYIAIGNASGADDEYIGIGDQDGVADDHPPDDEYIGIVDQDVVADDHPPGDDGGEGYLTI